MKRFTIFLSLIGGCMFGTAVSQAQEEPPPPADPPAQETQQEPPAQETQQEPDVQEPPAPPPPENQSPPPSPPPPSIDDQPHDDGVDQSPHEEPRGTQHNQYDCEKLHREIESHCQEDESCMKREFTYLPLEDRNRCFPGWEERMHDENERSFDDEQDDDNEWDDNEWDEEEWDEEEWNDNEWNEESDADREQWNMLENMHCSEEVWSEAQDRCSALQVGEDKFHFFGCMKKSFANATAQGQCGGDEGRREGNQEHCIPPLHKLAESMSYRAEGLSPQELLRKALEMVYEEATRQGFEGTIEELKATPECPEGQGPPSGMPQPMSGPPSMPYDGGDPPSGHPQGMQGGQQSLGSIFQMAIGRLVDLSQDSHLPDDAKSRVNEALAWFGQALGQIASGTDIGGLVAEARQRIMELREMMGPMGSGPEGPRGQHGPGGPGGVGPTPEMMTCAVEGMREMVVVIPRAFSMMEELFADEGYDVRFAGWQEKLSRAESKLADVQSACSGGDPQQCGMGMEAVGKEMESMEEVVRSGTNSAGVPSELRERTMRRVEQTLFAGNDPGACFGGEGGDHEEWSDHNEGDWEDDWNDQERGDWQNNEWNEDYLDGRDGNEHEEWGPPEDWSEGERNEWPMGQGSQYGPPHQGFDPPMNGAPPQHFRMRYEEGEPRPFPGDYGPGTMHNLRFPENNKMEGMKAKVGECIAQGGDMESCMRGAMPEGGMPPYSRDEMQYDMPPHDGNGGTPPYGPPNMRPPEGRGYQGDDMFPSNHMPPPSGDRSYPSNHMPPPSGDRSYPSNHMPPQPPHSEWEENRQQ